jgi:hypothetical protein
MSKQILEQVLEHILNKEEGKASDLLHTYFVEKGRSIYESLIQSDELAEEDVFETEITDDAQGDFADDIETAQEEIETEEMFSEDEMEGDDEFGGEEELGGEEEFADDLGGEEEFGGEEGEEADMSAVQDAVLDVEDALDELKSLFAELQADEAGEEEFGGEEGEGEEELGGEEEFGGEDDEMKTEESLEESADLIAVAKPTPGDNGQNTKSPVTANSGAKGMAAKPVKLGGSAAETGGKAAAPKDMNVAAGNKPGQKSAPQLRTVKAPAKPEAANGRSPIAGK